VVVVHRHRLGLTGPARAAGRRRRSRRFSVHRRRD
jgi:hypothetical protein